VLTLARKALVVWVEFERVGCGGPVPLPFEAKQEEVPRRARHNLRGTNAKADRRRVCACVHACARACACVPAFAQTRSGERALPSFALYGTDISGLPERSRSPNAVRGGDLAK
jgi:hypothetical protein